MYFHSFTGRNSGSERVGGFSAESSLIPQDPVRCTFQGLQESSPYTCHPLPIDGAHRFVGLGRDLALLILD